MSRKAESIVCAVSEMSHGGPSGVGWVMVLCCSGMHGEKGAECEPRHEAWSCATQHRLRCVRVYINFWSGSVHNIFPFLMTSTQYSVVWPLSSLWSTVHETVFQIVQGGAPSPLTQAKRLRGNHTGLLHVLMRSWIPNFSFLVSS